MVRTAEDAGYVGILRRDDNATVQEEHDPTLVHDGTGE